MLELILILLGVLAIASIPLVLLYWSSQRRIKKSTAAELEKHKRADLNMWRLFGAFFMLAAAGLSVGPTAQLSASLVSAPWYVKLLIFLFGLAIILAANHEEKKRGPSA